MDTVTLVDADRSSVPGIDTVESIVSEGRRDAPADDVSRREPIALVKPGESIVVAETSGGVITCVRRRELIARISVGESTVDNDSGERKFEIDWGTKFDLTSITSMPSGRADVASGGEDRESRGFSRLDLKTCAMCRHST